MFCDRCGEYAVRRAGLVEEIGTFRCARCHREFERRVLPLSIVTGASGAGKTSIIPPLQRLLTECGVLDKDAMWATTWDMAYNNLLRVASALAQGGRHTVIVGTILPEMLDPLSDRCLVGMIRYANLHCDDENRARRLLTRRTWDIPDDEFIDQHRVFAQWLLDHAATDFDPPMSTFDTTSRPPGDVARDVAAWVRNTNEGKP